MLGWIGAILLSLFFMGFFRCDCKCDPKDVRPYRDDDFPNSKHRNN